MDTLDFITNCLRSCHSVPCLLLYLGLCILYRSEGIERSMMLRTKAMREKEEMREMRKYRFALIRVRFPDGILLQVSVSDP